MVDRAEVTCTHPIRSTACPCCGDKLKLTRFDAVAPTDYWNVYVRDCMNPHCPHIKAYGGRYWEVA